MKLLTNRGRDNLGSLEKGLIDIEKKNDNSDTKPIEKSDKCKGCIIFSKVMFYLLMVLLLIFLGYVSVIYLTLTSELLTSVGVDSPRELENFDSANAEGIFSSSTPENMMTSTQENEYITTIMPIYNTNSPDYNNIPNIDQQDPIPFPEMTTIWVDIFKKKSEETLQTENGTESERPVDDTTIPDSNNNDQKNPIQLSGETKIPEYLFVDSYVDSYDDYAYDESDDTTTTTTEKITTSTEQMMQTTGFSDFKVAPTSMIDSSEILDTSNMEEEGLLQAVRETMLSHFELADIGYPWDTVEGSGLDSVEESRPYADSVTQKQIGQGIETSTMSTVVKPEETEEEDYDFDQLFKELMAMFPQDYDKTEFPVTTTPKPLIINDDDEDEYDSYTYLVPDELFTDTEDTKTVTESVESDKKFVTETDGSTDPTTIREDVTVVPDEERQQSRDTPETESDSKFREWLLGKIEHVVSKNDAMKNPNDTAPVPNGETSNKKTKCDCVQEPVFPRYPRGQVPFISMMRMRTVCTCREDSPNSTENSAQNAELSTVDDRLENDSDSDEEKPWFVDPPEYGDIPTRSPVSRS